MAVTEMSTVQTDTTQGKSSGVKIRGPSNAQINQAQDRASFFHSCVERMLTYWQEHAAVRDVDVTVLDRERHRIVKNILLGLDLQSIWPLVKTLVIAFAPYMERRGHWDAWYSLLEQAIHMAQQAEDLESETILTSLLARVAQRMSRPQDVVRHYSRAIKLARQTGNRYEEARACSNLGYLYVDGGHWWRSEVFSRHALAIFEGLDNDHGRAHTHNHLGLLYVRRQFRSDAEIHLNTACRLWEKLEDEHSLIYGYENLGLLYIDLGDLERALSFLNRAAIKITQTGENAEIGNVWQNMAYAFRLNGQYGEAEIYAHKAEGIYRQNANILGLAWVWHNLAMISLLNGDRAKAESYKEHSLISYRQLMHKTGEEQLLADFTLSLPS